MHRKLFRNAISTGSDHGRYNRRLYEEIEAEILTIDPQESLLEMQRSSDLIYELSKAIIHDRTIKQCFFEFVIDARKI